MSKKIRDISGMTELTKAIADRLGMSHAQAREILEVIGDPSSAEISAKLTAGLGNKVWDYGLMRCTYLDDEYGPNTLCSKEEHAENIQRSLKYNEFCYKIEIMDLAVAWFILYITKSQQENQEHSEKLASTPRWLLRIKAMFGKL